MVSNRAAVHVRVCLGGGGGQVWAWFVKECGDLLVSDPVARRARHTRFVERRRGKVEAFRRAQIVGDSELFVTVMLRDLEPGGRGRGGAPPTTFRR